MEIQKFQIARHYLANYGKRDHKQNEKWKVPIVDLDEVVNKLIQLINNGDIKSFISSVSFR